MSGTQAGELIRLAGRIEAHASSLRERAIRLGAAAASTRWQSAAATLAHRHMQHTVAELIASAVRLDHAAATLRAHAASVRRVDAVVAGARRLVDEAEHLAGVAGHRAGHAAQEAAGYAVRSAGHALKRLR